jgi:hypothetical protein
MKNFDKSELEAAYKEVSNALFKPNLGCYNCPECNRVIWLTGGPDSDEPCEHLKAILDKGTHIREEMKY